MPATTLPARLKSSTGLALHFLRKGLPRRSGACPAALRGVLKGEGASATTAPQCTTTCLLYTSDAADEGGLRGARKRARTQCVASQPKQRGLGPAYARAAAGQAAGLEAGPPEPALAAAYPTAGVPGVKTCGHVCKRTLRYLIVWSADLVTVALSA